MDTKSSTDQEQIHRAPVDAENSVTKASSLWSSWEQDSGNAERHSRAGRPSLVFVIYISLTVSYESGTECASDIC